MNPDFNPYPNEQLLINSIQKYFRGDYALIRLSATMINKNIIDASYFFRFMLENNNLIKYSSLNQKEYRNVKLVLNKSVSDVSTSFYTANTRKDPRFWMSKAHNYLPANTLVYFTVYKNELYAFPLVNQYQSEDEFCCFLSKISGINLEDDTKILTELTSKLRSIYNNQWIKSVSPHKLNPKDAGDTLENKLGIKANSLISADYKGKIELKTKLDTSTTKDTLFSMVPDWSISEISSSPNMILTYGYPTNKPEKYPDFTDLYVTVSNIPNNQGLFMTVDYKNELIIQKYRNVTGYETDVCCWKFKDVKSRLENKHPKTMWIVAQSCEIHENIHFRYYQVELTQNPIFTEFLRLIEEGHITYDWRGRVKNDGSKYKDKGHCFRIKPNYRNQLFGQNKKIDLY